MNMQFGPTVRAMVWKETKENAKWALLGLLGISLALVFTIAHQMGGSYTNSFKAVWDSAGWVMTFGAPAVGLSFGLLQILPELRRDQWAFLVHRPAARATLFWGKAITGMGLTVVATLLPLLGLALWAQAPGHIPAPFDPRLLLGGLAAILTGLVFYAAGLLTALRSARWYGSRALPVPATILCALQVEIVPEFWEAAAVAGLFLVLLLTAARGSFLTTGQYLRQPRTAKVSLGVTLYFGLVATLIALTVLIFSTVSTLLPSRQDHFTQTYYAITHTGRILRVTNTDGAITAATDLSGHPVTLPASANPYNNEAFLQEALLSGGPSFEQHNYNDSARYAALLGTDGLLTQGTIWYYVPGRQQIMAYSLRNERFASVLGPQGFAPDGNNGSRFAGPLRSAAQNNTGGIVGTRIWLAFSHALYLLDLSTRSVTPLLTSPLPIRDIIDIAPYDGYRNTYTQPVYVATVGNGLDVFSANGRSLFTASREYDPPTYPYAAVSVTPNGQRVFLHYSPRWRGTAAPLLPSYITEFTADGKVLRRDVLPSLPNAPSPSPSVAPALFGLLSPPMATGAATGVWYLYRHNNAMWYQITDQPSLWELFCVLSVFTGLLSALFAWLIGRRCVFSRSGQWAWTAGAFWLGLPGVLLLLSLRDWPARETCPHCGRLRVVGRDQCEHCGVEFRRPAPDGTEIFDDGGEVHTPVARV